MYRTGCLTLTIILAGVVGGCGGGAEEIALAPVSGTVRLDDEPLADARIEFRPNTNDVLAPSSYGHTDEQGRYTLELLTGEPGAVPGEHTVSINLPIEDKLVNGEYVPGDGQLPTRYNRNTGLTITILPKGRDDADFDLESE